MDARKFLLVSLGLLALACAYHLGATRTDAQGAGAFVAMSAFISRADGTHALALTSDGDVWDLCASCPALDPQYLGNLRMGPIPVTGQSFGETKSKYRK